MLHKYIYIYIMQHSIISLLYLYGNEYKVLYLSTEAHYRNDVSTIMRMKKKKISQYALK